MMRIVDGRSQITSSMSWAAGPPVGCSPLALCEALAVTFNQEALICIFGNERGEQCDGADDDVCPGNCQPNCTCPPVVDAPAVSEWGLIVLTLLLVTAGTVAIGRRRRPVAG